jgi:hypothetical protein
VLRRGATILVDNSNPATTSSLEFEIGQRPQPGDVIDVYRPHTAPTPSKSLTIPSASAVFDPSNSLVAVTAPAALVIRASAGTFFSKFSNSRTAMNTPSGQTRFDFAASDGIDPAYMLTFANYLTAGWTSPDGLNEYYFPVAPGDLTAPSLKIKLASKLKSSKLKSSIPVTVTSSEVASAKLTLTLPAKLKTAKAKSPRVIATGKVTLKAGSKKFKVKLTKSGKKLLKRLRASKAVSQTATLTVVATDASGNVATSVKKTKLASR